VPRKKEDEGFAMKNTRQYIISAALVITILTLGCAGVQEPQKDSEEQVTPPLDWVPKTLAILPFENNSVTDADRFAPLSKGLSAMLITDLKSSGTSLRLIERQKIQSLLKEIALSQTGSVDLSTATRAGKILGAQAIAFGSFMVLGNQVRIDTRIIRVETSELVMAESIIGGSDAFLYLERRLAKKIATSLKIAFELVTPKSKGDINPALFFSKGLDALDRGDKAEARKMFEKCIELDPAYRVQVENVKGLDQ